jgi:16S rRNA (cytosine1402-N4)-methyltransferase
MFAARTAGGEEDRVEGGVQEWPHVPIMVEEVVNFFAVGLTSGLFVDGTAGTGGHSAALAEAMGEMSFLCCDRDPDAVSILQKRFSGDDRFTVKRASYTRIPEILNDLGVNRASAAFFDLGLSSLQLDDPDRGFSYRTDGPLNMRFDDGEGPNASELVNRLTERELADMIYLYGQEGRSRKIARAIVRSRPLRSTRELADVVASAVGGNPVKILSRVFQALRIAVNREMEELDVLLDDLDSWLEPGGRVAFITFHSLEDRKVKLLFRDHSSFKQADPKWLLPCEEEIGSNSRARSARLRMGVRV